MNQKTFPATSGNSLKCDMLYALALNINILSHVSVRKHIDLW